MINFDLIFESMLYHGSKRWKEMYTFLELAKYISHNLFSFLNF